jgi:hypothetical protein
MVIDCLIITCTLILKEMEVGRRIPTIGSKGLSLGDVGSYDHENGREI